MSCEDYPTAQTAKTFKLDAETVNEVVTLEQDRTSEASDGKTKKTLWGIETDATNQRDEFEQLASDQRDSFEASFSSQFNFKRIGNISDYAGQSLPEADKLNSYQFPDDSGDWYVPEQGQSFPITIPADPTVAGSNWFLQSPSGVYRGLWPDTGGSANKGDTYQTQVSGAPTGQYFTALQNTTVDPVGDDVNWREVVSVDSFSQYTDIVYKDSGSNSAVENMIESLNLNPLMHAIGTYIKTGGTTWEYLDSTGPITIENFRAFNAINVFDCGVKGDGSDDGPKLRYAFNLMHTLNKQLFFPAPETVYSIQTADPDNTDYALVIPETPQGERALSLVGETPNIEIKLETPSTIEAMMYWQGSSYNRSITNLYFNANNLALKVWDATEAYHPYLKVSNCAFYRATEVCSDIATFQSKFERVTNAWSKKGYNFTGPGASRLVTSLHMSSCYAVNCSEYGFWFDELTYCSFDALACDNSGVAYYVDISRGVSFNGCGAESSKKIMEIRASQGTVINGIFGLNMGDSTTPVDNLIQVETGDAFSIAGMHITGSSGQYDKKLELLTGSFQSACVVVQDSSISPNQTRWVSNVAYDKPIKFVVFDTTNRDLTIQIDSYESLLNELELLKETTVLHNITYQLPDGIFNVDDFNLVDIAGSGIVEFIGGASTVLTVSSGHSINMSNYNGIIRFKDMDIEFLGTTPQLAYNFRNCKNIELNNVEVNGPDVNSRRIQVSNSKVFMNNAFSRINWSTSGDWEVSIPRASSSPSSGEWPTATIAYDSLPDSSGVGWVRTSSQTWEQF